jgi:hypothetical protein
MHHINDIAFPEHGVISSVCGCCSSWDIRMSGSCESVALIQEDVLLHIAAAARHCLPECSNRQMKQRRCPYGPT